MRQSMSNIICYVGITLVLSGVFGSGRVFGQQIYYSGSAQYTTGTYFFERSTNSFYLTNGFRISGSGISISLNVPYMVQNTPWISYSGVGYIPTGGPQSGTVKDVGQGRGKGSQGQMSTMATTAYNTVTEEAVPLVDTVSYNKFGFSDPNVYLSARLTSQTSTKTTLYLNTSAKIPIADPETGFGTGAWDFGAGLSMTQRFGTLFITGDVMYWHLGDMKDLNFKDPISYALGLGKSFRNGKWLFSSIFTGYTPIIEGYDPPMSLGIGIGHFLTKNISLNANMSFGLSESSSDIGGGIGWSIRL